VLLLDDAEHQMPRSGGSVVKRRVGGVMEGAIEEEHQEL
jgi:hypothetical protein